MSVSLVHVNAQVCVQIAPEDMYYAYGTYYDEDLEVWVSDSCGTLGYDGVYVHHIVADNDTYLDNFMEPEFVLDLSGMYFSYSDPAWTDKRGVRLIIYQ